MGCTAAARRSVAGDASERPMARIFPSRDEARELADRILDRRGLVDAMLVVEVDRVDAQTPEAGLAARAHVLGAPVDPTLLGLRGVAHDPELGGDDHGLAAIADGAPDELLVGEGAIDVGRVEERHTEVDRPVDGGDALGLVGRAVELRHAHAAEA